MNYGKEVSVLHFIENTHTHVPPSFKGIMACWFWNGASFLFLQICPAEWDYVLFLSLSRAKVKHCLKKKVISKLQIPSAILPAAVLQHHKWWNFAESGRTVPSQSVLSHPSTLLLSSELTSFLSVKHSNKWRFGPCAPYSALEQRRPIGQKKFPLVAYVVFATPAAQERWVVFLWEYLSRDGLNLEVDVLAVTPLHHFLPGCKTKAKLPCDFQSSEVYLQRNICRWQIMLHLTD